MADDELAGLSREELLELVRRQQAELAAHDEKIQELEEELAPFRRPAKTPENSSVPPSRVQKANRIAGRRKLGPKRGHARVSLVQSEPDVVVECRPRARVAPAARSCRSSGGAGLGGARSSRCRR